MQGAAPVDEQPFPVLVMSLMQQSSPVRPAPRSLQFAPPHSPHPDWEHLRETSERDRHQYILEFQRRDDFTAEGVAAASVAELLGVRYDLDTG